MIPSRRVFEEYADDYDHWFDENDEVYQAQHRMLRAGLPPAGNGLEVGVGSGRFAALFGIRCGIDPSRELVRLAKHREVEVVIGEGEHLPYCPGSFNYVLMMTVICYLDDVMGAFRESHRVLEPDGTLVVGFIESGGEISLKYQSESTKGRFLRYAKFRTAKEVSKFFKDAGFVNVTEIKKASGFCVMSGQK